MMGVGLKNVSLLNLLSHNRSHPGVLIFPRASLKIHHLSSKKNKSTELKDSFAKSNPENKKTLAYDSTLYTLKLFEVKSQMQSHSNKNRPASIKDIMS